MKVEIIIDAACTETTVTVRAEKMTEEVNDIVGRLSHEAEPLLTGFRDDRLEILAPESLVRIYTAGGKVYAQTDEGEYQLRLRLYEAEQRLHFPGFVRISHAEIINLKKAVGFDLSFAGTICVTMSNQAVTYVSRRYVAKIKQLLGV